MNKVLLMGRLVRDPALRYGSGDNSMTIARYTLAVDRRGRRDENSQTADFIGCVAFGKSAEFAERFLHKGTKILITGRIQTGSYTNRDGQKVYTTDVIVEDQEFAESKNASAGTNEANAYRQYQPHSNMPSVTGTPDELDGFMNIPDGVEELPFS